MEHKVLDFIRKTNMFENGENVLVGISGGADSVCLLLVLKQIMKILNINLFALHVNHSLRGLEADEDERFVVKLCKEWDVKCDTAYVNVKEYAVSNRCSVEEAARIMRYNSLRDYADKNKCKKIAVAHHGDDQAETILFQMLRGSGLRGISGMQPLKDGIARPLLCVRREEIENYLHDKGVAYRTDSSNLLPDCSRNKIRLKLLPFINENINRRAVEHLNNLANDAIEADCYFQHEAGKIFSKYAVIENEKVSLDLMAYKHERIIVAYVFRMCIQQVKASLKDVGRAHIDKLFWLAEADGFKEYNLPYGIKVKKEYSKMIFLDDDLSKNENNDNYMEEIVIDRLELENKKEGIKLALPPYNISLIVKKIKKIEISEKKAYTKYLDYDKIKNVLSLRTRKTGDYIVINSFGGSKKVKDYMIDEKIPRNKRDKILLVADGNSIMWVVGHRISEKYKISKDTTRILEITIIGG